MADMEAALEGLARLRLPAEARAHLEIIAEAAFAARDLVETATELDRFQAGDVELAPEPICLRELTDAMEARWRRRSELAGVTLLVSYDGPPDAAALLDPARLNAAFDALVGQAVARTGRGVVEASLQARAGEAGLALVGRLRDSGPVAAGEPARFDASAAKLKLELAARTIHAMGGRVRAAGNPGAGVTITFELEAPAADPAEAPSPPVDAPRFAHVLVVDDNATNRMVVEALCELYHCSAESVGDGVEAVEAARNGRFDVILMDIKMPRMDGLAAARHIRKLPPPAGQVPIIALTANADADDVGRYLAAGMLTVVEKPIKPEALVAALNAALEPPTGAVDAAA
jgi:two-component system, sensor histidine kinase